MVIGRLHLTPLSVGIWYTHHRYLVVFTRTFRFWDWGRFRSAHLRGFGAGPFAVVRVDVDHV